MLRRRYGRDRIHLQESEAPNRVEHRGRRAVEQLRADSDAPCPFEYQRFRANGRVSKNVLRMAARLRML